MVHAWNPSTEEAQTRGSRVQGQPGLCSKAVRACLKKPRKKTMKDEETGGKEDGKKGRRRKRGEGRRWETRQGNMKKMSAKRHWGKHMCE